MFSFIVHYPPIYPGASQKYPLTTTDSKVCGTYRSLGIFVRDNLVVKFIRCVIFSWVSYTHENILPLNFVRTETFLPTLHFLAICTAVTD